MATLRTLIRSVTTSTLIFSSRNPAFTSAFVSATRSNSTPDFGISRLSTLSSSKLHSTSMTFPPAVVVQPGTSPVEEQKKLNPIDSSCTILVVGANRGIGLEFVKQCLQRGATVIATYRSDDVPSSLQDLQSEYPSNTLYPLQIDLTSESSIKKAAIEFKEMELGSLTHIIHNAGIYLPGTSFDGTARGPRGEAPKVTKETLMKSYEINTVAPLLIAQNFVPLMGKRSETLYPVLALLSSKVGSVDDNGSGGAYAYRSSKSALNNIAKSLSIDLSDEVRVALLHPGYVRTDMTSGKGLIDADESVGGMLNAIEATDASTGFRFVDYKACLIPW